MPVSLAPSLPPHVAPPAPRAGLNLADDERLVRTASAFRAFLETLDLDLDDPNLVGTDFRVARAYRELFAGLAPGAEPNLTTFANVEGYADIVSVVGIPFFSVCAHHFLPFFGVAHVGYIPGRELLGLSKFARVVEYYARRPQLQERLTQQIAELLDGRLAPAGLIVVIESRHLCMEMRGVGTPGSTTRTVATRGAMLDATLRARFLAEVRDAGFTSPARQGAI